MTPIRGLNLKKLFGKLTPYADDVARGFSNYGDDALRLASNYGDEALDYGMDVAKYADDYADDIAKGFGNPKAFGKDVPFDVTPGRIAPPPNDSTLIYDYAGNITGVGTPTSELSRILDDEDAMVSVQNILKSGKYDYLTPPDLARYLNSPTHLSNTFADMNHMYDLRDDIAKSIGNFETSSNTLGFNAFPSVEEEIRLRKLYAMLNDELF